MRCARLWTGDSNPGVAGGRPEPPLWRRTPNSVRRRTVYGKRAFLPRDSRGAAGRAPANARGILGRYSKNGRYLLVHGPGGEFLPGNQPRLLAARGRDADPGGV